jgi:hypothetical protein
MGVFGTAIFPTGSDVPKDATWIFLPSPPDCQPRDVTMTLDLTNSSGPTLQLQFQLRIYNSTRTFGLGILQPLPIVEYYTYASNQWGNATKPVSTKTGYGTYFTRSQYNFKPNTFEATVTLTLTLSDPITSKQLGRTGTGFTFGSGKGLRGGPEVDEFLIRFNDSPDWILNHELTLSVNYQPDWQLSLAETFPSPGKQFAVENVKAATWSLNFPSTLSRYFVTVYLVWAVPKELIWRDGSILISGIIIGTGAGFITEVLYDEHKKRSRIEASSES